MNCFSFAAKCRLFWCVAYTTMAIRRVRWDQEIFACFSDDLIMVKCSNFFEKKNQLFLKFSLS